MKNKVLPIMLVCLGLSAFCSLAQSVAPEGGVIRFCVNVDQYLAGLCADGSIVEVYTNYFWNKRPRSVRVFEGGDTLNSNGPNIVPVINTNMTEHFGVDFPDTGTWRIYLNKLQREETGYNVFYTPYDIREASIGTVIPWVLKYNIDANLYQIGWTVVAKDPSTGVNVINGELKDLVEFTQEEIDALPEAIVPGKKKQEEPSLDFGKPFSIITFGDFFSAGGNVRQNMLVWGDMSISNMTIATDYTNATCPSRDAVIIGGDFEDNLDAPVYGNIVFGGIRSGSCTNRYTEDYQQFHMFPIALNTYGNASPTGALTQAVMRERVVAVSSNLSSKAVNGSVEWVNGNTWILTGTDTSCNVFQMDASNWDKVINVVVPEGSRVIVNITGENITNKVTNVQINGVDSASPSVVSNVVFNFTEAKKILVGIDGVAPNYNGLFLAPFADVTWDGGNAYGPIIVGGNLICNHLECSCTGYNGYGYGNTEAGDEPVTDTDTPPVAGGDEDILVNRADLAITEMYWIDEPTLTGQVFRAYAVVANRGQVASKPCTFAVYRSASEFVEPGTEGNWETAFDALAPGDTRIVEFGMSCAPEQGTHTLRAFVDNWAVETEWSKGDNQLTLTYQTDPIYLDIQLAATGISLTWNNFWGQTYTLSGKTELTEETWHPIQINGSQEIPSARTEFPGSEFNTVLLPFGSSEYRFFRLSVIR